MKYRTEKSYQQERLKGVDTTWGFQGGKKGKYLVRSVGVFRGLTSTGFRWEVYGCFVGLVICDEL